MKQLTRPPVVSPVDVKPTSKYALITCAVGQQIRNMLRVTGPFMTAYARKYGLDYHVIQGEETDFSISEKFRVGPYLDHYERVLFLDADTIITPDCPNLFDVVPEHLLGIHDDTPFLPSNWNIWKEYDNLRMSQLQLPLERSRLLCLNTGVIVASKQHKSIFDPITMPYERTHCSEQNWISMNVIAKGFEIMPLKRCFNWQWWIQATHPNNDTTGIYIWHPAGYRVPFLKDANRFEGNWAPYEYRTEWLKKRSREIWAGYPMLSLPEPANRLGNFPWDIPGSEWMTEEESKCLLRNVRDHHGEIGTYAGYSAWIAAQVAQNVICFDYFTADNPCGIGLPIEVAKENLKDFVTRMGNSFIQFHKGDAQKFLTECEYKWGFDSFLIDGAHEFKDTWGDIQAVRSHLASGAKVVFHDFATYFPGVMLACDLAVETYGWKQIDQAHSMRVYQT